MVCPLSLSLETAEQAVASVSLFLESQLGKLRISNHQVTSDHHHLDAVVQILGKNVLVSSPLRRIHSVRSDVDIFRNPLSCSFELFMVVDAFINSAVDFTHVDGFGSHSQVVLEEILIDDASCDSHGASADGEVALVTHCGRRDCRTAESEKLLLHVLWDCLVICFLDIMSVDSESRKTLLSMGCHDACKIHCTGTLCAVEAPYCLYCHGIIVISLGSVAPAWCHRKSDGHRSEEHTSELQSPDHL